jgi:hypothetical protein
LSPTVDFNKLCDYLEADDNILFALVFVSAAGSKIPTDLICFYNRHYAIV